MSARETAIDAMVRAFVEDDDSWAEDMTDVRADMERVLDALSEHMHLVGECSGTRVVSSDYCTRCGGTGIDPDPQPDDVRPA